MRPAPITAFVGHNGSGKTLSAIAFAAASGRRVLTNVPSRFDQFTDISELRLDVIRDADIVFDEAGVLFSARTGVRNEQFLALVQQFRKANARFFWTAPAYARADKMLREVTQMVVKCKPMAVQYPHGSVWPQPRAVLNVAFEAYDIDTMAQTVKQSARRKGFRVWSVKRQGALFDTMGTVQLFDPGADVANGAPVAVPDAQQASARRATGGRRRKT